MTRARRRRGSIGRTRPAHIAWLAVALLFGTACGSDEQPLATWGDSSLTSEQYDEELSFFLDEGETLSTYNLDPPAFLERIVKYFILYEAANRSVATLSPSDEGRLQLYRDELVRDRLIDEAYGDIPLVTEEDIRARYDAGPVEERLLFHFRAGTIEVARSFHDAVVGGEDFDVAFQRFVAEHPDDVGGGELGYIRRGTLPPALEDEAWRLEAGDVSEAFMSSGANVLFCAEIRNASYEDLRDRLRRELVVAETDRRQRDLETNLLQQGQVSVDSMSVVLVAQRIRAYRDSVPETGGAFPKLSPPHDERPLFLLSGRPFTVAQMTAEMGRFDPNSWPVGEEEAQITEIARRRALSQIINAIALQRGLYEDADLLAMVERKRKEFVVNTMLRDLWRGLDATDEDVRERLEEAGRQMPGPVALEEVKRQLTRLRRNQALEEYLSELIRNLDVKYYPERIPTGTPVTG